MALLPIRPPRFGLALSSRSVTLVERAGGGRGLRRRWAIRRVREHCLPSGLVLPTDTAANLLDPETLTAALREFLAPLRGQCIALAIPDQAAQMALFEFDALPRDAAECEALLRWRYREDLNVACMDSQLVYRAFRGIRPASRASSGSAATRVLGVSIRRDILAQYERFCEGIGLLPVSIGVSSLDLFDLCLARMPRTRDVYFAHCSADGFTFIAAREGIPTLVRVKSRCGAHLDVAAELLGTLQFYEDLVSEADPLAERPEPCVWLIDTSGNAMKDGELPDLPDEGSSLTGGLRLGQCNVQVHHLGWERFARVRKTSGDIPASGLSALAGMVAA